MKNHIVDIDRKYLAEEPHDPRGEHRVVLVNVRQSAFFDKKSHLHHVRRGQHLRHASKRAVGLGKGERGFK